MELFHNFARHHLITHTNNDDDHDDVVVVDVDDDNDDEIIELLLHLLRNLEYVCALPIKISLCATFEKRGVWGGGLRRFERTMPPSLTG